MEAQLMDSEIIKSILLELLHIKSLLGYVITLYNDDPLNNPKLNITEDKECPQESEVTAPALPEIPDLS